MSAGRSHHETLRLDRPEDFRLVWALIFSLLLHAAGYGIYEGGKKFHVWEKIHLPAWVQKITQALIPPMLKRTAQPPQPQAEPPLMFVEVNPANAVAEPPKNAKYYAAQSTRAANPDADKDTDAPKISGTQERIMRTEDTQLSKAQPLQPVFPRKGDKTEEETSKPALHPGDLTLAKPQEQEIKTEGDASKPKPRRIAEAKARLGQPQRQSTAGERAKQDAGVRQKNIVSSLDAIGSPFGAYDAAIVAAIQERWYALLEERSYASDRAGKVVLEFRLNYDGRVTDMKVAHNSVDEILCLLCQKSILDPAPFARWPSDMRRMAGGDFREVRFTFFYN
jgi:hypothetical protein